jgi:hypothetical protein
MEFFVFNIAIKRNERKYGGTSTVAMTKAKCILLCHGKYLCNNQISSLAQFIDTWQGKKVPHSIFETRLLDQTFVFALSIKFILICEKLLYIKIGKCKCLLCTLLIGHIHFSIKCNLIWYSCFTFYIIKCKLALSELWNFVIFTWP